MSQQKLTTAAGAATVRLPPSPDLGSMPSVALPPPLVENQERFRSAAQYSTFAPQTMATTRFFGTESDATRNRSKPEPYSMTALAGPHGIVVFETSQPHKTRMVLRHEVQQQDASSSWTALEFQTQTTENSSLLLAGARGSGVLVWDVGGQTLSPLLGRLGPTARSSDLDSRGVVDISWKPSTNTLASCTVSGASLWDIRSTMQTNGRPSLRFGTVSSRSSSYVQVSCGADESQDHVALLDIGGTVRVYDLRMIRHNPSEALCTLSAHAHAGIGLTWIPPEKSQTHGSWLTWGLEDDIKSTVKMWRLKNQEETPEQRTVPATDSDSYWFMDGSSERSPASPRAKPPSPVFKAVAKIDVEGLACARVCPTPMKQSIVTVSASSNNQDLVSWQADLWGFENVPGNSPASAANESLREDEGNISNFGFTKMASFPIDDKDDSCLQTVVGRLHQEGAGVGSVRAAELALIPENDQNILELVFSCLTSNGYVVSYAIPEAEELIPSENRATHRGLRALPSLSKDVSPIRRTLQMVRLSRDGSGGVGTGSIAQLPLFRGVYHDSANWTGASEDAASALNDWTDGDTRWGEKMSRRASGEDAIEVKPYVSLIHGSITTPLSPQEQQILLDRNATAGIVLPFSRSDEEDPISRIALGVEGGIMQFDMEIGGFASGGDEHQVTREAEDTSPEKVGNQIDGNVTTPRHAQSERVPCPRLCGAVFGSRGLVRFHNGEVRKMWSWYAQQQDSNSRRLRLIQSKGGNDFGHELAVDNDRQGGIGHDQEKITGKTPGRQSFPRTLKELNNMTVAAKEAEWGDDGDGNLEGSDGSEEDIFEDDGSSVGSNSSDSDDFLLIERKSDKKEHLGGLYEVYFGDARQSVAAPLSPGGSSTGGHTATSSSQVAGSVVGSRTSTNRKPRDSSSRVSPSSELLAPVVQISHEYDIVVLNGQCPELAEQWILGGWNADKKMTTDIVARSRSEEEPSVIALVHDDSMHHSEGTHRAFISHGGTPDSPTRYEQLPTQSISQLNSDTALRQGNSSSHADKSTEDLNPRDDKTVHGGISQSAVRPNRTESMVFLKKLFTYQKSGSGVYPTLISSLPDAPMLPKSISTSSVKRSASSHAILQTLRVDAPVVKATTRELSNCKPKRKFGVYVEAVAYRRQMPIEPDNSFLRTTEICLENASICNKVGQPSKAHVWSLLAQVVDNILENDIDSFNGWSSDGALGQHFISSVLSHYELQGDVQMLASIICVLGRNSLLLPPMQNEKYDAYIRRYAELLFGWRLLTTRAEVNKHLVRITHDAENEEKYELCESKADQAFVPLCSRCGGQSQPEQNLCPQCGDYAFRCSICTNAVRGLFTFCVLCGHGGHVEHVVPWFETHVACPSGCGCVCLLNTLPPRLDEKQSQLTPTKPETAAASYSIETV